MTQDDSASSYFNQPNLCGVVELVKYYDSNGNISDLSQLIIVSGTKCDPGILIQIYSLNYTLISQNTLLNLTFTVQNLNNNYNNNWTVSIPLLYYNPCDNFVPSLQLQPIQQIIYSVINPSIQVNNSITYTFNDQQNCAQEYGAILSNLTFNDTDYFKNINSIISVQNSKTIVVQNATSSQFGNYTIRLSIYFENYPTISSFQDFSLSIICDSSNSPIVLTSEQNQQTQFQFQVDSFVYADFQYSHYFCESLPNVQLFFGNNTLVPFQSIHTFQINGIGYLRINHPLNSYYQVGDQIIFIKFLTPIEQIISNLFEYYIVDPCIPSNVKFSLTVTPTLQIYSIGDSLQSYTLLQSDQVSTFFNTSFICGVLNLENYTDPDQTLSDLSSIITFQGNTFDSGVILQIYSSDQQIIDQDTNITLWLTINNLKYNTSWIDLLTISLQPYFCSYQNPTLSLNNLQPIVYSVINPTVIQYQPFTFNSTCFCSGGIQSYLNLPTTAQSKNISDIISIQDQSIVISGANLNQIGSYSLILTIQNVGCRSGITVGKSEIHFQLTIVCDASNSQITLSPNGINQSNFTYQIDQNATVSFVYSHFYCPTNLSISSTFKNSVFTFQLYFNSTENVGLLLINQKITNSNQIGNYTNTIIFTQPLNQTFNSFYSYQIKDPCLIYPAIGSLGLIDILDIGVIKSQSQVNQSFSYTVQDKYNCISQCGNFTSKLLFTQSQSDLGLQNVVQISGQSIIAKNPNYTQLGSYFINLQSQYSNCSSTMAEQLFNVIIECDPSNSSVILTPIKNQKSQFIYKIDSGINLTFEYSHKLCGPPQIQIFNNMTNDYSNLFQFNYTFLTSGQINIFSLLNSFEQVGYYNLGINFLQPIDQSISSVYNYQVLDPCITHPPSLLLSSISNITYSVINPSVVLKTPFNYTINDKYNCTASFGPVQSQVLYFKQNDQVNLNPSIQIQQNLSSNNGYVVISNVSSNQIGDYLVALQIYFMYNGNYNQSQNISIKILCDQNNSKIYLNKTFSTDLVFNFIINQSVSTYYNYSHYYCQNPVISFFNNSKNITSLFSYQLTEIPWQLQILSSPNNYSQVGFYNVSVQFSFPHTYTNQSLLRLFVVDPCINSSLNYTIQNYQVLAYTFGDPKQSSQLVLSDAYSSFFNTTSVCGTLKLNSFTDQNKSTRNVSTLVNSKLLNNTTLNFTIYQRYVSQYLNVSYVNVQLNFSLTKYSQQQIFLTQQIILTDLCTTTQLQSNYNFTENEYFLTYIDKFTQDLSSVYVLDSVSQSKNDPYFCGNNSFYIGYYMNQNIYNLLEYDTYLTQDQSQYANISNITNSTFYFGPIQGDWHYFEIYAYLDNYQWENENFKSIYVEALYFISVDSCIYTQMYPFYTDSDTSGASFPSSLQWNLASNTDLYQNYLISPSDEAPEITGPHKALWSNTQSINQMTVTIHGKEVIQNIYYLSDIMTQVRSLRNKTAPFCGTPILQGVQYNQTLKANQSLITLTQISTEQYQITLSSSDPSLVGSYLVSIPFYLDLHPQITNTIMFNVTVNNIVKVNLTQLQTTIVPPNSPYFKSSNSIKVGSDGNLYSLTSASQSLYFQVLAASPTTIQLPQIINWDLWNTGGNYKISVYIEVPNGWDQYYWDYYNPVSGGFGQKIIFWIPPNQSSINQVKLTLQWWSSDQSVPFNSTVYNLYLQLNNNPKYPSSNTSLWNNSYCAYVCSNWLVYCPPSPPVGSTNSNTTYQSSSQTENKPIVIQKELFTTQIQDPDQSNIALKKLQSNDSNKSPTGVNYNTYSFNQKAQFRLPDGSIQLATVCLPALQGVTNQGLISIVFPRLLNKISANDINAIKKAKVIQIQLVLDSSAVLQNLSPQQTSFDWTIIPKQGNQGNSFQIQVYFNDPGVISRSSSNNDQLSIVFSGVEQFITCVPDLNAQTIQSAPRLLQIQGNTNQPNTNSVNSQQNSNTGSTQINSQSNSISGGSQQISNTGSPQSNVQTNQNQPGLQQNNNGVNTVNNNQQNGIGQQTELNLQDQVESNLIENQLVQNQTKNQSNLSNKNKTVYPSVINNVPQGYQLKISLPPQFPPNQVIQVQEFLQNVTQAAQGTVVTTFILVSFFSFSAGLILGSINALQMISHLPMISILLTDNAQFLFNLIQQVVGFDIFDPTQYFSFEFTATVAWFQRFDDCGYSGQNYFQNIGGVATFMHLLIIRILFNPIFNLLHKLGIKGIANTIQKLKMSRAQVVSSVILTFNEAYFELLIGSLLALPMINSIEKSARTGGDEYAIDFAVATLIPISIFPFFVAFFVFYYVRWRTNIIKRNEYIEFYESREQIKQEEFDQRYKMMQDYIEQIEDQEQKFQDENPKVTSENQKIECNNINEDEKINIEEQKNELELNNPEIELDYSFRKSNTLKIVEDQELEINQENIRYGPDTHRSGTMRALIVQQVNKAKNEKLIDEERKLKIKKTTSFQVINQMEEMYKELNSEELEINNDETILKKKYDKCINERDNRTQNEKQEEELQIESYEIFSPLTENLRSSSHSAQFYFFIFIIRRVVFVMSVLYIPSLAVVQLIFYITLSLAMMIYLLWANPFEEKIVNQLETFNESIVLIVGIHEAILLGFIDDLESKLIVGNSMVFFIIFMVFVNVFIVFYDFVKQLHKKMKKEWLRLQAIKKLKERKLKLSEYLANQIQLEDISVHLSQESSNFIIDIKNVGDSSWKVKANEDESIPDSNLSIFHNSILQFKNKEVQSEIQNEDESDLNLKSVSVEFKIGNFSSDSPINENQSDSKILQIPQGDNSVEVIKVIDEISIIEDQQINQYLQSKSDGIFQNDGDKSVAALNISDINNEINKENFVENESQNNHAGDFEIQQMSLTITNQSAVELKNQINNTNEVVVISSDGVLNNLGDESLKSFKIIDRSLQRDASNFSNQNLMSQGVQNHQGDQSIPASLGIQNNVSDKSMSVSQGVQNHQGDKSILALKITNNNESSKDVTNYKIGDDEIQTINVTQFESIEKIKKNGDEEVKSMNLNLSDSQGNVIFNNVIGNKNIQFPDNDLSEISIQQLSGFEGIPRNNFIDANFKYNEESYEKEIQISFQSDDYQGDKQAVEILKREKKSQPPIQPLQQNNFQFIKK